MTRKRRRLFVVLLGMATLGIAAALVLFAFEDNLVFFYSPSDVAEREIKPGQRIRVGGLVEAASLQRTPASPEVSFAVTDMRRSLKIVYTGILPDLFREGQGIVAEGTLRPDGAFEARSVLAKHDENYMPPEVADSLKRAGVWQHREPQQDASGKARP
ncbi:MAG: cytochrome c maturation protein CcmE [Alphaproteobacteria bacterium]|nr:cytochrome c maturation protein CcmE [Alphaproteobacteria bacterium]